VCLRSCILTVGNPVAFTILRKLSLT
jgi:hypothetical protein